MEGWQARCRAKNRLSLDAMGSDESRLRALLGAAESAVAQGRVAEAKKSLGEALAAAPANPEVFAAAGLLSLQYGDASAARTLISQAIALEPHNPRYRVNLAA